MNKLINKVFFTIASLIFHTAWFVLWFVYKFDISLLTNIVSLEAIYLTILVGMAQRAHHKKVLSYHVEASRKTDLLHKHIGLKNLEVENG